MALVDKSTVKRGTRNRNSDLKKLAIKCLGCRSDSLCPCTSTINMPHSENHEYLRTEVFATIKNHKFSTCRNESHQRLFANNLKKYSHRLSEKFPNPVRCSEQISIRLQIQSKLFHLAYLLKSSTSSLRRNHKRKEPILSCGFSRIICNF